jgi:hypothetical protein
VHLQVGPRSAQLAATRHVCSPFAGIVVAGEMGDSGMLCNAGRLHLNVVLLAVRPMCCCQVGKTRSRSDAGMRHRAIISHAVVQPSYSTQTLGIICTPRYSHSRPQDR